MRFEKTYHKDAGPIVRWVATALLAILSKIERPLYDYAVMYEVFFDDEDEDDVEEEHDHEAAHNYINWPEY